MLILLVATLARGGSLVVTPDGSTVRERTAEEIAAKVSGDALIAAEIAKVRDADTKLRRDVKDVREATRALATTNTGAQAQSQQIENLKKAVISLSTSLLKVLKEEE